MDRPDTLAWVVLGVQALACASLAVRRAAPLTVVAVLGVFTLAVTLLIAPAGALTPANDGNVWAPYSTVVAAYGPLFYRRNRRTAYVALAALTFVVMRPWEPSVTVMTIGLLRTALGPLLALYFDARRRMVLALVERAERAERERHLLAERARAEERARLAAEMHDVVTHRVSLMVLQAGALRVTAQDESTRQAAEELRAAGCQALDELRDLVGILRTAPEGDRTPSVAGFPDLVAESIAVGVRTELIESGDPALASPMVGRTAYRVLRGVDQRAQARARRRGDRAGGVPRHAGAAHRPQHAAHRRTQPRPHRHRLRSGHRPSAAAHRAAARYVACRTPSRRRVRRRGDAALVRPDRGIGGVSVARVVVVDDEPLVCVFLRTILGSAPDIEVVDEAHDGAAGIEAVRRSGPDVVLMDLRMPGMDGLTAIGHINELPDPPNIVVLTTFDADQYVLRALRAGATGFLVKSTPPEDLIGLVRTAAQTRSSRPPPPAV